MPAMRCPVGDGPSARNRKPVCTSLSILAPRHLLLYSQAVAVDEFKLVLIGLAPSGIPLAAGGSVSDPDAPGQDPSNRSGRVRRKTRNQAVKDKQPVGGGIAVVSSAHVADVDAVQ